MSLIFIFAFISILSVGLVLFPLLTAKAPSASDAKEENEELKLGERADLLRLLQTLSFEKDRGLIAESEYERQVAKVQKRLAQVHREGL